MKVVTLLFLLNFLSFSLFSQSNVSKLEVGSPSINKVNTQIDTKAKTPSPTKLKANQYNFMHDYDQMDESVKQKINKNKSEGLSLSNGIIKVYAVNIISCETEAATNQQLNFLNTSKEVIKSAFVSNGKVNIYVQPDMNSVELKSLLINKNIDFDFVSEKYLVK